MSMNSHTQTHPFVHGARKMDFWSGVAKPKDPSRHYILIDSTKLPLNGFTNLSPHQQCLKGPIDHTLDNTGYYILIFANMILKNSLIVFILISWIINDVKPVFSFFFHNLYFSVNFLVMFLSAFTVVIHLFHIDWEVDFAYWKNSLLLYGCIYFYSVYHLSLILSWVLLSHKH